MAKEATRIPLAIFVLALAFRLLILFATPGQIVSHDQSWYFYGGLSIAEHAHPLSFVLGSDTWREWQGPWTIAPLYYLLVALVFRLFGPHLVALQLVQCALGAATAVGVARLGEQLGGRRGAWAGMAYALHWPAADLSTQVFTENLHVPLLVASFVLLAGRGGSRRCLTGGFVLGLSGLARTVSSAFLPLAAMSRLAAAVRDRAARRAAVLVLVGGLGALGPWVLRNVVLGRTPNVETVGVLNLMLDNAYLERPVYREPGFFYGRKPLMAGRQAARFVWRNVTGNPRAFLGKIGANASHLVRLDALHEALYRDVLDAPWEQAGYLFLGDGLLLAATGLLLVFLVAGERNEAWWLLALWLVYYVLMIVVVFHVEVRYRSALTPIVFAGAGGGLALLRRRDRRVRVGLAGAGTILIAVALVYGLDVGRRAQSEWRLRSAVAALSRGAPSDARRAVEAAAAVDPNPARPWVVLADRLLERGTPDDALAACREAQAARPPDLRAALLLPWLLSETEAPATEQSQAVLAANDATRDAPRLALAAAWRLLPPPRTDVVALGRGDYGSARGFLEARPEGRWTEGHAELRVAPRRHAESYGIALDMTSPEPSPFATPEVTIRDFVSGSSTRCTLGRGPRTCTVKAKPAQGGVVQVAIESPTWSAPGQTPEQGVLVASMTVTPLGE